MDANPKKSTDRMTNRRRVPARPDESYRWLAATRETFARHFDLVVVIWVLALAVAWSVVVLSKAHLPEDQWSSAPQSGAAWVIASGAPAP